MVMVRPVGGVRDIAAQDEGDYAEGAPETSLGRRGGLQNGLVRVSVIVTTELEGLETDVRDRAPPP